MTVTTGSVVLEGIVLGLGAGLLPGPLLALVIAQTLRHGVREGIKVAIAPLVTDAPIILLALTVLTGLAVFRPVLGSLTIAGGLLLLWLGYESFRAPAPAPGMADGAPRSVLTGAVVNALSPHPYLFWFTVGGPAVLAARAHGLIGPVLFVVGFTSCLVGAKVLVAVLVGRTRHALDDRWYRMVLRVLGVLIVGYAVLLLRDGGALLAGAGRSG